MNQQAMWSVFLNTGAPEVYLLYCEARKAKDNYVSNNSGSCDSSNKI